MDIVYWGMKEHWYPKAISNYRASFASCINVKVNHQKHANAILTSVTNVSKQGNAKQWQCYHFIIGQPRVRIHALMLSWLLTTSQLCPTQTFHIKVNSTTFNNHVMWPWIWLSSDFRNYNFPYSLFSLMMWWNALQDVCPPNILSFLIFPLMWKV